MAVQVDKPLECHATEGVPLIGGWLAEKLFGTAENAAPDGTEGPRTDGPQTELAPAESPPAQPEPRGEPSR